MTPIDDTTYKEFLGCQTPDSWCEAAMNNLEILMIDHKNCEYKAANNALHLMAKYPDREALCMPLSRLAREELSHYEQVLRLMKKMKIQNRPLSAGRYAARLRDHVSGSQDAQLLDFLVLSAFIEARSCERFSALIPYVPALLSDYYQRLIISEARHFTLYLKLCETYFSTQLINQRIQYYRPIEADLILKPDHCYRFHSGPPLT